MFFFSHLFISKELYRSFKKETDLSRLAFAYGNVKPDLPPACFKDRHTLDNYFFIVYDKVSQLINGNLGLKEFSVRLGEVCHFVCDFFCYYHMNERLHKKSLPHLLYELRLHLKLRTCRLGKRIRKQEIRTAPKGPATLIFEMRREYCSEAKSVEKDIEFAFSTAVSLFERILYFKRYLLESGRQSGYNTIFTA